MLPSPAAIVISQSVISPVSGSAATCPRNPSRRFGWLFWALAAVARMREDMSKYSAALVGCVGVSIIGRGWGSIVWGDLNLNYMIDIALTTEFRLARGGMR